jgi:hypothetical protein
MSSPRWPHTLLSEVGAAESPTAQDCQLTTTALARDGRLRNPLVIIAVVIVHLGTIARSSPNTAGATTLRPNNR